MQDTGVLRWGSMMCHYCHECFMHIGNIRIGRHHHSITGWHHQSYTLHNHENQPNFWQIIAALDFYSKRLQEPFPQNWRGVDWFWFEYIRFCVSLCCNESILVFIWIASPFSGCLCTWVEACLLLIRQGKLTSFIPMLTTVNSMRINSAWC